jgi:hypothetical protein
MRRPSAVLKRQAAWQRSRRALSWSEKLRLAAQLRQAALALRASGQRASQTGRGQEVMARPARRGGVPRPSE